MLTLFNLALVPYLKFNCFAVAVVTIQYPLTRKIKSLKIILPLASSFFFIVKHVFIFRLAFSNYPNGAVGVVGTGAYPSGHGADHWSITGLTRQITKQLTCMHVERNWRKHEEKIQTPHCFKQPREWTIFIKDLIRTWNVCWSGARKTGTVQKWQIIRREINRSCIRLDDKVTHKRNTANL